MKKLLLLLILPLGVLAQNTIALPDVINYSKQSYAGGLQNWDIKQDKNGILYFANNEGLLTFDGKYWNLYPLPNKTIVRSIEIGDDNRVYVGGQDEIGFFSPDLQGKLKYTSILELLPQKDRSIGDVWDIVAVKKSIFFRSASKILKLIDNNIAIYNAPTEWSFLGFCNDKIYAHDYNVGLMIFENNHWTPISTNNKLPSNNPITAILHYKKDSILITTLKNGIYVLSNNTFSKIQSTNNTIFENQRIYSATKVNDDWLALGTNDGGIYIINTNGNIIQSFSKTEGLQNNNVLSVFLDSQSNLWLGLNNGIDLVAHNSAIKHINPMLLDGSGYTALIKNNKLYLGTSNSLESVELQSQKDLSFSKGIFSTVQNTSGQVWNLSEVNNEILMGHHDGAFVVQGNSAKQFSSIPGFWNFTALSSTFPSSQMVAGSYKGLLMFDYKSNQFIYNKNLIDFVESCRFVAIDQDKNIWVSHPYHGVYKLNKRSDNNYSTKLYTDKQGLPSALNNHVYIVKNEVLIATEKGIYIYNASQDKFEASPSYQKIIGQLSVRYLKEDASGNVWFIHDKQLGVIDFSAKQPTIIYLPELNGKMMSGFEFIYPVNDNNIFLGGEKGFFHINYEKYKENVPKLDVRIRSVRISSKTDSILFGGYFNEINEKQIQTAKNIFKIDNEWKTIRFEFSSALYGYQPNLEYSYRLKGFDENWSEWTKRTEKEYTNLPANFYTFEVKVRNNLGKESAISSYSFKILPPWYQTIWAYLLYFIAFVIGIFYLYKWQMKKFIQQQQKHEEEQKRLLYIMELERAKTESEIVTLKNEKLEADIHFKNSELASSAMHLVKKGELLTKIKAELSQIIKGLNSNLVSAELKKMIRALDEDDHMDDEWENFTKHFDKVHSDFLVALKEKHPTITPNEIKLSAYLRMNLSTKEIAQLMNISVRGVEISRYRLRKKLNLTSDINLFDYLITIK